MTPEKFNPYFNPNLPKSLEQERLKREQKSRSSSFMDRNILGAREATERLGIPVFVKPIGGRRVLFQKDVEVSPLDNQPESQEPTGQ